MPVMAPDATPSRQLIASSPAARRIEQRRQRLQIASVLLLALIAFGGRILHDSTTRTVTESLALFCLVVLWRRSVILRRRALGAADRPHGPAST